MSQLKDFYIRIPKKLIFISFVLALMVDFVPVSGSLYWLPDITLLILIYWLATCPQYINLGMAFVAGLLVDIGTNGLLGSHALAYLLAAYPIIINHRQFGMQNYGFQAVLVFLAVSLAEVVLVLVAWLGVNKLPDLWVLVAPVLGAVLWLVINKLLTSVIHSQRFR